jgi:effector-binding domain-containing protein
MKILQSLTLTILFFSHSLMATEEPEFNLILKKENLEIREYLPKILAQVKVIGTFDEATSAGFKLLADYIFGNNISTDGSSKIAMTAPVILEPKSKIINMTAPIITEGNNREWLISFIMPKEFSIKTLPKPNNKDIKIISLPKEKYAVIVFSGLVREVSYKEQAMLLNNFISDSKLTSVGQLQIARYNPPWTLPFFRRNELMVKIH